ncbi:MAG TPA: ABC transporter permease [Bryobacteraceae bacterium]|nr:ABC transporter permease [Bryobacteraceae bacterium]
MDYLWQDLRYGIRTMLSKPGFTAAAVVVLSLGIGANAAIFSLVNAFLLKPLYIKNPSELAGCYSRDTKKPDNYRAFSYPNYVDLREKNQVFSSLMAHDMAMVGVAEGDVTRRVFADVVSSNYFATFGVPLFQGRAFTDAEERPGSNSTVAIVSYSYWRKTGDRNLLGKSIRINGRIFTIVGIAPEGFTGTTALISSELYLPLGAYQSVINDFEGHGRSLEARDHHTLILVGRLRPGVTAQRADAQLAVAAAQLEKAYPGENRNQTFMTSPLSRLNISTNPSNDAELRMPAILLLSMAGVVLLIASLNLANMMLARGTARRKEIAIRLAIGGGRGRIVRQLFTEGLILSVFGGIGGLVLAAWSTSLLVASLGRLAPLEIVYHAGPDVRVLGATMGFCVFSTVLFSLGPAWKLSRPDVVCDLKKASGDEAAGRFRGLFSRRNLLVMGQLSLSLMMLTASGLFVRSAIHAANVAPGFVLDNGLIAELDPSLAGYDETAGRQAYSTLLSRMRGIPGVESAAVAAAVPFGMTSFGKDLRAAEEGKGDGRAKHVGATYNIVSEDYFKTLGIPLLRGRTFMRSEAASAAHAHVAVIDKLAAERLWPGAEAIGRHLRMDADDRTKPAEDIEVVGIVGNVQDHIIGRDLQPHLYVPFGQQYQANMQLHLKTAAAGKTGLLDSVRREMRAVDPRLPVLSLKTMRDHLDASFDLWIVRTGARMLTIFGIVALVLAVIGLYGVKAYMVAQRTRELGIRMALGADSADTLKLILGEGLSVSLVGIAAGMVLALGLGRVLAGILYEVSAFDPVVYTAAPVILATVSLAACYLPARRAARVDPMIALRYE